MRQRTLRRSVALTALLVFGVLFLSERLRAAAQSAAPQSAAPPSSQATPVEGQEKTAEQTHKNIQALKGLPDSQLMPVMNMFSVSLGVRCDFCHVKNGEEWAWDKDDKRAKQTARKMIQLTVEANKTGFNGRAEVSCYTCHLGREHPVAVPPLPQPVPAKEEARRPREAFPTVQEIVAKYVTAAGGKEAAAGLKTRALRGSFVTADGNSLPLEIWFAAPSKVLATIKTPQGDLVQALNGDSGWARFGEKQHTMDPGELARTRSLALGLEPLQLKEPYPRMTIGGKAKVGDREAFIIRTATPDKKRVQLYFDTETGLLLRRYTMTETPVGIDPEQIDFEDYREVDGVKVPFVIRVSYVGYQISGTLRLAEVKHNSSIDESKFTPPK